MADSLAEMVKSLKPGVRVKRGRDWNYGDIDGNGEGKLTGTFMHEGRVLFKVIWDCGNVQTVSCDDFLPRTHAYSHTRFLAARTSHARVRFAQNLITHALARFAIFSLFKDFFFLGF